MTDDDTFTMADASRTLQLLARWHDRSPAFRVLLYQAPELRRLISKLKRETEKQQT